MIDGAGIGSCMAANKIAGIRAAMCYDEDSARNSREHNGANVLTLGGKGSPMRRCGRLFVSGCLPTSRKNGIAAASRRLTRCCVMNYGDVPIRPGPVIKRCRGQRPENRADGCLFQNKLLSNHPALRATPPVQEGRCRDRSGPI